MADGNAFVSSVSSQDLPSQFVNKPLEKASMKGIGDNLTICDDKLRWNGKLDELKRFFSDILCLHGKWNSPGGDVKLFSSDNNDLNVKWRCQIQEDNYS